MIADVRKTTRHIHCHTDDDDDDEDANDIIYFSKNKIFFRKTQLTQPT